MWGHLVRELAISRRIFTIVPRNADQEGDRARVVRDFDVLEFREEEQEIERSARIINLFPLQIGIPNPFRSSSLTVTTIDAFHVSPGSRLSRMHLGARACHHWRTNHQSCREAGKTIRSDFFSEEW
jgi:hypothetical protein